jgi:hypothetical protein
VLLRLRPSTSHNGHIYQRVLTILIQKERRERQRAGTEVLK